MPDAIMKPFLTLIGAVLVVGCAGERQWPERDLRVAVQVPNPCWSIRIAEVWRREDALFAVVRLQPPGRDQVCAQVITTVSHAASARLPEGGISYLVTGRRWSWGDPGPGIQFVDDAASLESRLEDAEKILDVAPGEGSRDQGPGNVE